MKKLLMLAALFLIMISNVTCVPLTQKNTSESELKEQTVTSKQNMPTNILDKSESTDVNSNIEDIFEEESLPEDDGLPIYTRDDEEEDYDEENLDTSNSKNTKTDDESIYDIKEFNNKSKDDESKIYEEEYDEENEE
ncbi:uncharacterized protein LOC124816499 isoform X2 [Hydra vulgaris]|uniref:Uncharacterized protein LOC124816499 isoform X2 n=1 Tax=Hydra vulgaris TaxID=6087 RepID=A0ABM4CQK3_HYDVU